MENVVGGGVLEGDSWLQISIDRNSKGIEVFTRVDPKVEDFIRGISEPQLDKLGEFGTHWTAIPVGAPLESYRLARDLSGPTYFFANVGGPLISAKTKQVNLSLFQLRGVGGEGVSFSIAGPFGRDYVLDLSKNILKAGHDFIRNYIVPVGVRLRISSKEL